DNLSRPAGELVPLLGIIEDAVTNLAAATAVTALFDLPVARIEVAGLGGVIDLPGVSDLAALGSLGVLGTAFTFALIASAESLFSAAAVDRLHDGPRTDYDRELLAQGVGNTLCGVLGALPMTAVIVRSAANVQAGARTKASRVLHGFWLLLFAALIPAALSAIPLAALAGVLVHAGAKLVPVRSLRPLWRADRGEAVILAVTAVAIVVTNLLEGVLLGLLLAVLKSAWDTSHLQVTVADLSDGEEIQVVLHGNATFLRLPRLVETLERLPADRPVRLDLSGVRHLDHACRSALELWQERHNRSGSAELVGLPASA
ncbi:SulP family inorganic anion transporter, partial [Kitasatospora sp. NPDC001574]